MAIKNIDKRIGNMFEELQRWRGMLINDFGPNLSRDIKPACILFHFSMERHLLNAYLNGGLKYQGAPSWSWANDNFRPLTLCGIPVKFVDYVFKRQAFIINEELKRLTTIKF